MLQVHQRLGDFEIIRLLGKGGMGEVYEAEQSAPRRRVALKVLAPWLARDEDGLRRFWREAEVPAQLDHPNIVRIISTGQTEDGIAYYTMQLVRGISAAEMIRCVRESPSGTISYDKAGADTPAANRPAPDLHAPAIEDTPTAEVKPPLFNEYHRDRYRTVVRIGVAVARALAYAHRQGFVHRDLKPSNIMMDHHDQVYVVDFGLTRALIPNDQSTTSGVLAGTPLYMSPEQASGKPVDPRSDIYSLGVTLFEMASQGHSPYSANRAQRDALLAQIRSGERLTLRSLAPEVPVELERIILKAMSFTCENRYDDAGQMAEELARLLESGLVPVKRSTRRRKVAPRQLAAAAGAAGVLIALGLVIFFWSNIFGSRAIQVTPATTPPELAKKQDNPLPQILRDRPWRVPINLFTKLPVEPIWSAQLKDPGSLHPFPAYLHLAGIKSGLNLLALDHDPEQRWFQFDVEMSPIKNQLGVFVGWHPPLEADPRRYNPYLEISLDNPNGVFRVGSHYEYKEGSGNVVGTFPLPEPWRQIPLNHPGSWHALRVRALDDVLTITADEANSIEIPMPKLRALKPEFANLNLRGAIGIWTNGDAMFRNAQIMAVPSEKP